MGAMVCELEGPGPALNNSKIDVVIEGSVVMPGNSDWIFSAAITANCPFISYPKGKG
jgi:hypothetical protein